MLILGIETSCDETGLALLDSEAGLLAHALHSQVDMHMAYGGVVPELASRDHIRRVLPLLDAVLADAGRTLDNIDAIAVTTGPGLAGALLVGASIGHALGYALGKPVLDVHHLEGHLLSPLLAQPVPRFPFVALLVSGATPNCSPSAAGGSTNCWERRWTTRPARRSTRRPSCSDSAIQAVPPFPGLPTSARRTRSGCPGRCSTATTSPSASAA